MKTTDRWRDFLSKIHHTPEVTLVGPFAEARREWPTPCIFVDRGNQFQTPHPLHISVGDGDSAAHAVDQPLPATKDYSDLAYALAHIPAATSKVNLLGFLGGRRDHEWLNIGETQRFLQNRTHPTECHFDQAVAGLSAGGWSLNLTGTFSVFAFRDTKVQMTGACRFQLNHETLLEALSSHGLSNEGHGDVRIVCRDPIFIFKNLST